MQRKVDWRKTGILTLIVGFVIAVIVLLRFQGQPPASLESLLPPLAATPYQNARKDVGYIGAAQCAACHPGEHQSYMQTAHSQALAEIELANEPPDGSFEDPASERQYRVYRKGDELRHEESIRKTNGEQQVLTDVPIKYVIGSGRFSRSYLVDREGFLFESPATWYSAKHAWGLSPGYENYNSGFQRPAELRCLTCHAGRLEPVDRSPHRVRLHALAIDCERCHGPGELHAAHRKDVKAGEGSATDWTIVNPAKLDRDRQEDICAQCHLHTGATVELPGRREADYRPGQRLSDYVANFGLKGDKAQMEVVGHMEQMRLSKCWTETKTLTCTTCHDPHDKPTPATATASYRAKCIECHTENACGIPVTKRRAKDAADNCMNCHMPRSPTEIPHFAFTHHRIGIHETNAEPPATPRERGTPVADEAGGTSRPSAPGVPQRTRLTRERGTPIADEAGGASRPSAPGVPERTRLTRERGTPIADEAGGASRPSAPGVPQRTRLTRERGTPIADEAGGASRPSAPGVPQRTRLTRELIDLAASPPEGALMDRNLGLGYLQLSDSPGHTQFAETYQLRARKLLESVQAKGLADVEVEGALARLWWNIDPDLTQKYARSVIAAADADPDSLASACYTLGTTLYQQDNLAEALPWLERTVKLRPTADLWISLSDCHERAGDMKRALECARRGSEWASDRPRYLERYIELLEATGQADRANELKPRLAPLFEYQGRFSNETETP